MPGTSSLKRSPAADLNRCHKQGKFIIKQLYIATRHQYQKSPWKRLTIGSKALPKHQFILWLILLCGSSVATKEMGNISSDCVLCGKNVKETMEHMMFAYDYSKTIWATLLQWIGERHQIGSWDEEIEWITRRAASKVRGNMLVFLFVAVVYHTWAERNQRRFHGKMIACTQRIKDIVLELHIKGRVNPNGKKN
ncbi:uncharacterized protein LOC142164681 [Nicotiana tabacum]|uniref:Uncharacterized protein LOC142164681 n=1 Tax=Nicotiana tabacum TaxID=4097 RepID=A0AC58S2B2_TOBAC